MAINWMLLVVGVGCVVFGLLVRSSHTDNGSRVQNIGFSVFGSIRQKIHGVQLGLTGKQAQTPRDWVGLAISAAGVAVAFAALFKPK